MLSKLIVAEAFVGTAGSEQEGTHAPQAVTETLQVPEMIVALAMDANAISAAQAPAATVR